MPTWPSFRGTRPAEALTGVSAEAAIGRRCWEVLGGHDVNRATEAFPGKPLPAVVAVSAPDVTAPDVTAGIAALEDFRVLLELLREDKIIRSWPSACR